MSDDYFRDLGNIGTAQSIEDALRNYGTIRWTAEEVTFGSETEPKASVIRGELEKRR